MTLQQRLFLIRAALLLMLLATFFYSPAPRGNVTYLDFREAA